MSSSQEAKFGANFEKQRELEESYLGKREGRRGLLKNFDVLDELTSLLTNSQYKFI